MKRVSGFQLIPRSALSSKRPSSSVTVSTTLWKYSGPFISSGFFTHNLAALRHTGPGVPAWSAEFDAWGREALDASDVDALLDFEAKAPAGRLAHPRTEHFAPLFVTLGAADAAGDLGRRTDAVDGFWMGLSKRSVQFG